MKTKFQHRFRKEITHLTESLQINRGDQCKALVPTVSTLESVSSSKDNRDLDFRYLKQRWRMPPRSQQCENSSMV